MNTPWHAGAISRPRPARIPLNLPVLASASVPLVLSSLLVQTLLTRVSPVMRFFILFVSHSVVFSAVWSAHARPLQVLTSAWMAAATVIVVTVGGNTTGDGTTTFDPQRVVAALGDVVLFNCMFLRVSFPIVKI